MTRTEFKGFGGIRLQADVTGSPDDPPVLLLHGGAQTRDAWTDASSALVEAGRHAVNLDMRGHGGSEWPADGRYDFESYVSDLRTILAQLPARPVIVAGSLGGWVALAALAGDGSNLASGLVLADAPPRVHPEFARAVGDKLKRKAAERGEHRLWDPRVMDAFDVQAVTDHLADVAPSINLPVLFVRGAASKITLHHEAETFVKRLPHSEFVEVEEAGHLVAAERADVFNALLLDFLERKAPRVAPEYRAGSDARTLRDAMGCFATGVTIITTYAATGKAVGLTANSFTSVSLDPPLLLVCIATTASTLPQFLAADRFAVNVLHIGQQPASNRFTRRDIDRFDGVPWEDGEFHVPLLMGSLANFECAKSAVHEGGDHHLLVGHVLKARFEPRRDPLLYFRGKYRRLHIG